MQRLQVVVLHQPFAVALTRRHPPFEEVERLLGVAAQHGGAGERGKVAVIVGAERSRQLLSPSTSPRA